MARKITAIVIHHSASPVSTTVAEIDGWHRTRGFSGIGYHWVIRWAGEDEGFVIEPGRKEFLAGAHCKGHNSDTIGVCLCGNFEVVEPQTGQLAVAAQHVANRCIGYGLKPDVVFGHREMKGAATACPGKHLNMDAFRALVSVAYNVQLMSGINQAGDGECNC